MKKKLLAAIMAGVIFIGNADAAFAATQPGVEGSIPDISGSASSVVLSGALASSSVEASSKEASTEAGPVQKEQDDDASAGSAASSQIGDEEEITPPDDETTDIYPDAEDSSEEASSLGSSEDESILESSEDELVGDEDDTVFPTGVIAHGPMGAKSVYEVPDGEECLVQADDLPSKFVTRKLPPLRNQSPYGTCWSFATTALAEISLLKQGKTTNPNLSELHLAYFTYNSVPDPLGGTEGDDVSAKAPLNMGGRVEWGFSNLGKWVGYADEYTADYKRDASKAQGNGLDKNIAFDDTYNIYNYYIEPLQKEDNEIAQNKHANIKKLIMDHGAVSINFYAYNSMSSATSKSVYNSKNNAYYNPVESIHNHAVVAVGWDDNFSRDNFEQKPPGDGAFLIRNSWTTSSSTSVEDNYGYEGYFWMSYYEKTLDYEAYAADFVPAPLYDNNYQYDGGIYTWFSNMVKGANVFTTHATKQDMGEKLKAVSFVTGESNRDYLVEIYSGLTDKNNPESGELVSSKTGTTGFAGMYTVTLDEPVYMAEGTDFSVVVTIGTKENRGGLGVEADISVGDAYADVSAKPGQSFYYYYDSWAQMSSSNIRIKAYTDNTEPPKTVPPEDIVISNVTDDKITLGVNQSYKITASVTPYNASCRTLEWHSSDESVATVANGLVVGVKPGDAVITVSTIDGSLTKEIELKVEIRLLNIIISTSDYFNSGRAGRNYHFSASPDPRSYTPKTATVWSTTTPEKVSVNSSTGEVTMLAPGTGTLTATIDGVSKTIDLQIFPSYDSYGYELLPDNSVKIWWDAAPDASKYVIYSEGKILADIPENGEKDRYEFIDDTYVGNDSVTGVTYSYRLYFPGLYFPNSMSVSFNRKSITYYLNGGTQNPQNSNIYIPGSEVNLYAPTAPEGYEFDGWFTDPSFGEKTRREKILTTDNTNISLYAKYVKKKMKVSFDTGCSIVMPDSEVLYGNKLQRPSGLLNDGYMLEGWYKDPGFGEEYDFNEPVTSDFTLYAKWKIKVGDIKIVRYDLEDEVPQVLESGESIKLSAVVTPQNAAGSFTWKEYETLRGREYAAVYPEGAAEVTVDPATNVMTIKAIMPGTVTISAVSTEEGIENVKSFVLKEVLPKGILIKEISSTPATDIAAVGLKTGGEDTLKASVTLKATVYREKNPQLYPQATESENQSVTWISSDESVVMVKPDPADETKAVLTPVSEGRAGVYAVSDADSSVRTGYDVVVKNPESQEDPGNSGNLFITGTGKNAVIYASAYPEADKVTDDGEIIIAAGKSKSISALVTPQGSDKTVVWSSANPAIADISASGKISAKTAGDVVITATSQNKNLKAAVRVRVYEPVTKLVLDKKTLNLGIGQSAVIGASEILPASADTGLVFSSSNESVVSVDANTGAVTAMKAGSAVITVRTAYGEKTAKCKVVAGNPVTRISVYSKGNTSDLAAGKTLQMKTVFNGGAKAQPTNKAVTWEIVGGDENDPVATINEKGVLKGIREGTVSVIARSTTDRGENGYLVSSPPYFINVYMPVKKAALSATSVSMTTGGTYRIKANITPAFTGNNNEYHATGSHLGADLESEIGWRLKNPADSNLVELTPSGNECTIRVTRFSFNKKVPVVAYYKPYASTKEKTLTCNVAIDFSIAKKLTLIPKSIKLSRGQDVQVDAQLTPMVPYKTSVQWEIDGSSTGQICFVDEDGNPIMTGSGYASEISTGTEYAGDVTQNHVRIRALETSSGSAATLKAYADSGAAGQKVKTSVTISIIDPVKKIAVFSGKSDVTDDSYSDSKVSLALGKSLTLKAVSYTDGEGLVKASGRKVTWSSSDPGIAKVDPASGKVTATGCGTVEITAASADTYTDATGSHPLASAKCKISVFTAATSLKLDKSKVGLATGISGRTRDASLGQYDVITAYASPGDMTGDIEWSVDKNSSGIIAVYEINTDAISGALSKYDKQNILKIYDDEYRELSYSEKFSTAPGKSLAIKALAPGKVKLTATAPGGKKASCTLTVYTHVTGTSLKLGWNGEDNSYSAPVTKTVTVNKIKKNVTVLEKAEDGSNADYNAYLDLKSVKSVTISPVLEYYFSDGGMGIIYGVPYSDRKSTPEEKAATALYNATKKLAVNSKVNFRSLNPAVATVNAKGVITSKSAGDAIIIASSADGDHRVTVKVTVNEGY